MAHLVLAVEDDAAAERLRTRRYVFDKRESGAIVEGLGDVALFSTFDADGQRQYFARARLIAIEPDPASGAHAVAILEAVRFFASPVTAGQPGWPQEAERPGTLSEIEFRTALLAGGEPARAAGPGLDDAKQAPLTGLAYSFAIKPSALRRKVLVAYGQRCALTGNSDAYRANPPDALSLVPIRSLEEGGQMHAGNLMPLSVSARHAWLSGHLTVGGNGEILVALDRIDPELLERLNPEGRIAMSADAGLAPDPEALLYHRNFVFNRRFRTG